MIPCAYCEKPLTCEGCRAEYVPPSEAAYQALSEADRPVICPACEEVLVCHWCKTPYDGIDAEEAEAGG